MINRFVLNSNLKVALVLALVVGVMAQDKCADDLELTVYQTSAAGDQFTLKNTQSADKPTASIQLNPREKFQSITGFGGAFTESSSYLLNEISEANRKEIISAYFSEDGANYSLTRTHINSCDFSLDHYSYAAVENDTALEHFSISPDKEDVIPMILDAKKVSKEGFKIIASPWTAPPWMKTNNDWYGGKLKKEFYPSWAKFFSKYIEEYKKEGIDIWGLTVENEPLGNDSHWESMHYSPEEMADFTKNYLGPQLKQDGLEPKVLVYDQNRGEELEEWAHVLLNDNELTPYIYGTAIHWYTSTNQVMGESISNAHDLAPDKHIIHTEGCIDSEVPHWNDDAWYWKKEATDWGYEWAKPENKKDHPKYVPVYRYARDIIGCLNNWVEGWIDWNMVLDEKGGPNLAQNWCIAPILVDTTKDEIYYTPLYYTMMHFSKFIRPEAKRIDFKLSNNNLMTTAVENKDGSIVVVILNMTDKIHVVDIELNSGKNSTVIDPEAIQTIIISK